MKVIKVTTKNLLPSRKRAEKRRKRRIALVAVLLLISTLLCLFFYIKYRKSKVPEPIPVSADAAAANDFFIAVLDVGQGSCTVIGADGEYMMVDGGTREATKSIEAFLDENRIDSLKYIVATHPHADHIGSLSEIISTYSVGEVLHNGVKLDTSGCSKLFTAIEKRGVKQSVPEEGSTYTLGEGSFTIISTGLKDAENVNDTSLCLRFEYHGKSVMITGDAGRDAENQILGGSFKKKLKSDILIAGHHGSSDANSEAFIKAVSPREAVISCGKDNDYGHPHREVISLFEKYRIEYRRTDTDGTVIYAADKEGGLYRIGGKEVYVGIQ